MFKCWASLVLLLLFNTVEALMCQNGFTRKIFAHATVGGVLVAYWWRSKLIPNHDTLRLRASLFSSSLHRERPAQPDLDHPFQEKEKRAQKPYCSPKSLNVRMLLLAAPTVVLLLLLTLCTLFSAQRYTSLFFAAFLIEHSLPSLEGTWPGCLCVCDVRGPLDVAPSRCVCGVSQRALRRGRLCVCWCASLLAWLGVGMVHCERR